MPCSATVINAAPARNGGERTASPGKLTVAANVPSALLRTCSSLNT